MLSPELGDGHETSGFSRCSRWCGGRVAVRGACAAIGDAGSRVPRYRGSGRMGAFRGRVPAGASRSRLRGRPQRCNRVSLGRGSGRPAAGIGGRSGGPEGVGDRSEHRHCRGSRRKDGERQHSHRVRHRQRPGRVRSRRQPQPAGRQHDGRQFPAQRSCGQARRAAARLGADGGHDRLAGQPGQSECQGRHCGGAGGGTHARSADPCRACQDRARTRCGVRKPRATARRRTVRCVRSNVCEPARSAGGSWLQAMRFLRSTTGANWPRPAVW